jgi:DNA-damage-inducible protein J
MATADINVSTDSDLKDRAGRVFDSLGLDMSTAINIFLRQTVKCGNLPFVIDVQAPEENKAVRGPFKFGSLTGAFEMSPDFDEPLEDFKDYME